MPHQQKFTRYLELSSSPGPLARTTCVYKVVRDEKQARFLEDKDTIKKENHTSPSTKKHHVLHLSDKDRSLTKFKDTREMVSAMGDAMTGHRHLYDDVGKLHGDISPATIFMNEKGKGRLVDWEHATYGDELIRLVKRLQGEIAGSRLGACEDIP